MPYKTTPPHVMLKSLLSKAGLETCFSERNGDLLSRQRKTVFRVFKGVQVRMPAPGREGGNAVIPVQYVRRLSKAVFDAFRKEGASVFDGLGNYFLKTAGILLERFVHATGKNRISLGGKPYSNRASRITRALLSEPARKWTQSELVKATGINQGHASLILGSLVAEGHVRKLGNIIGLDSAEALLEDWASYYRFDRHRRRGYAFNAVSYDQGLQDLAGILGSFPGGYAFTGWSGAYLFAPAAVPQIYMAYVRSFPADPAGLGLHPVEAGANVFLYIPQDEGAFQYAVRKNGLTIVSPPQLYLDVRKMPGRAVEQAEMIKDRYMEGLGNGRA